MHDEAQPRPTTRGKLFGLLSGRKIALLIFGLALAIGGYALGFIGPGEFGDTSPEVQAAYEAEGVGFTQITPERRAEIKADLTERTRTAWQWMSPHLVKIGLSLFIGLVAGIFFRAFIVKAAAITALAIVGIAALAYFQVLDFSIFKTNLDAANEHARANAESIKGWLMSFAPSTTGALIGFFLGFMRK